MTPDSIISAVCDVTGVSRDALLGDCRLRKFSRARFLAWIVIRDRCGRGSKHIGRYFNRNHTTILYGFGQGERLLADNKRFRLEHDAVLKILEERIAA